MPSDSPAAPSVKREMDSAVDHAILVCARLRLAVMLAQSTSPSEVKRLESMRLLACELQGQILHWKHTRNGGGESLERGRASSARSHSCPAANREERV